MIIKENNALKKGADLFCSSVSLSTAVSVFISITVRLAHLQRCRAARWDCDPCVFMPVHTMLEWDDELFNGNGKNEGVA